MKPEEYDEFYKQIAHDTEAAGEGHPLRGRGEDRVQGAALHPGAQAVRLRLRGAEAGLKLYVQRVLIMDRCEAAAAAVPAVRARAWSIRPTCR